MGELSPLLLIKRGHDLGWDIFVMWHVVSDIMQVWLYIEFLTRD